MDSTQLAREILDLIDSRLDQLRGDPRVVICAALSEVLAGLVVKFGGNEDSAVEAFRRSLQRAGVKYVTPPEPRGSN